jgi:serine/threonine protein kinase
MIDEALREFRILKMLDPHNVHWFERKTESIHKLYLIEPLMVGPELLSVLPSITPDQKPAYAIALVEAVAQFHHAGLAHCDLQLQNVIVLRPPGNDVSSTGIPVRMKLINFGLAQPLTHAEVGIGPESTDIFSLGIILYEIFTGRQGTAESVGHENQSIQIFDGKTEMANLGWLPSDDIDPAIQAMINAMVSFLPSSRPTLDKVSAALSGASTPDR